MVDPTRIVERGSHEDKNRVKPLTFRYTNIISIVMVCLYWSRCATRDIAWKVFRPNIYTYGLNWLNVVMREKWKVFFSVNLSFIDKLIFDGKYELIYHYRVNFPLILYLYKTIFVFSWMYSFSWNYFALCLWNLSMSLIPWILSQNSW